MSLRNKKFITYNLIAFIMFINFASCDSMRGIEKFMGNGNTEMDKQLDTSLLDTIAEAERMSGYTLGMGLSESMLREDAGDLSGAVLAAYKDLAWAYSFNSVDGSDSFIITTASIEDGIKKVKELYSPENKPDISEIKRMEAFSASDAVVHFVNKRYKEASEILSSLFYDEVEPDAFSRWMILACALGTKEAGRAEQSAYRAIQARYRTFPAYWYFGAMNFSGSMSADYAEHCINLCSNGPYAEECRTSLASFAGLPPLNGPVMLSRKEIQDIVVNSVNNYDPELLLPLLPLVALDDNPYTVFVSGLLRELSLDEKYKAWFENQENAVRNNFGKDSLFADRLRYITRG
jgi:hypothetical protein